MSSNRADDFFVLSHGLVVLISNFSGKNKKLAPPLVKYDFRDQLVAGYGIFFIPHDLLNDMRIIF